MAHVDVQFAVGMAKLAVRLVGPILFLAHVTPLGAAGLGDGRSGRGPLNAAQLANLLVG